MRLEHSLAGAAALAAAVLLTAATGHCETITSKIKAGETAALPFFTYAPGCVAVGQFRGEIVEPPAHGRASFHYETVTAKHPPCTGQKFVGNVFRYTAAGNYRGADHFAIRVGHPVDTSETRFSYETITFNIEIE